MWRLRNQHLTRNPVNDERVGLAKDRGITTRQLELPDTYRRVSLVYRHTLPRIAALEAFAALVRERLPNTVRSLLN